MKIITMKKPLLLHATECDEVPTSVLLMKTVSKEKVFSGTENLLLGIYNGEMDVENAHSSILLFYSFRIVTK